MKGSSLVHRLIIVGFFFLFFAISCLNALSHAGLVKSLPDIKDSRSSMGVLAHTLQLRITKIIFIISVTAMFTGITGSSMRPVVTFSPSWNKILSGDSITMTCDVDDAVKGSVTYTWYRNNRWTRTGKTFTIQSAITRHSGDYQCRTSEDNISEAAMLSVTEGPVVLQSPPYIYEGDYLTLRCHSRSRDTRGPIVFYRNHEIIYSSNDDSEIQFRNHRDETAVYKCTRQALTIGYSEYSDETDVTAQGPVILQAPLYVYDGYTPYLRCHSRPEYSVGWTRFYKDDKLLQGSGDEGLYLRRGDMYGRYRCEKRIRVSNPVTYMDSVSVPIRDLFSSPEIKLTPSVTTEGDSLTQSVTTEGDHLTRSVTTEGEGRENRNMMQINIIRLIVSGLIVIMGCAFLSHHLRSEVIPIRKRRE